MKHYIHIYEYVYNGFIFMYVYVHVLQNNLGSGQCMGQEGYLAN